MAVDQAGARVHPVQALDAAYVFAPVLAAQHQHHHHDRQVQGHADLHAVLREEAGSQPAVAACQRQARGQQDRQVRQQKPEGKTVTASPGPDQGEHAAEFQQQQGRNDQLHARGRRHPRQADGDRSAQPRQAGHEPVQPP